MKRFWWMLFGEWVVIYDDGKMSRAMRYGTAKDYAAIFGGTIEPSYHFTGPVDDDDSHLT